jgi:hypothetical protein
MPDTSIYNIPPETRTVEDRLSDLESLVRLMQQQFDRDLDKRVKQRVEAELEKL